MSSYSHMNRFIRNILAPVLILSLLVFPSIAHAIDVDVTITDTDYNPYTGGHTGAVQVFIGNADKPCKELGLLKASGSKLIPDQEYIDALKEKARDIGADAITNIQFDTGAGVLVRVNNVLVRARTKVVRATAVRY